MAQVLVTYDVSINQPQMKANMIAKGYGDNWSIGGQTQYLPYTTLWKDGTTTDQALQDMRDAARAARTNLERAVAVGIDGAAGIPGEPQR